MALAGVIAPRWLVRRRRRRRLACLEEVDLLPVTGGSRASVWSRDGDGGGGRRLRGAEDGAGGDGSETGAEGVLDLGRGRGSFAFVDPILS
jgi:hypothetical protein